jgi:tRNA (guanine37-N1)-methyltransferase
MYFHIITIFPDSLSSYLGESIIKRALKTGKIKMRFYNPRDFTKDKNRRIDGRPYGGGPGMVLEAEPIIKAVKRACGKKKNVKIIILSPRGKQFTNLMARTLSKKYRHIVLVAGHYEGIDARVRKALKAEEISIGPYVLTGGELPAMVVIDALTRQIYGVLGKRESLEEERVSSGEVYTRPEVIIHGRKKYRVPSILLSGNHRKIEEWKRKH